MSCPLSKKFSKLELVFKSSREVRRNKLLWKVTMSTLSLLIVTKKYWKYSNNKVSGRWRSYNSANYFSEFCWHLSQKHKKIFETIEQFSLEVLPIEKFMKIKYFICYVIYFVTLMKNWKMKNFFGDFSEKIRTSNIYMEKLTLYDQRRSVTLEKSLIFFFLDRTVY